MAEETDAAPEAVAETAQQEPTGKVRSVEDAPAEAMAENAPEVMLVEDTVKEYNSVAAFRAAEATAVIALPDMAEAAVKKETEAAGVKSGAGDTAEEIRISVMSGGDTVMFSEREADGRMIAVRATDYADSEGHSSSTVYGGEVTKEREYITEAGYTYIIINTMDEAGNYQGLHAAIAVGSYEVITDFWGYSEEEALQLLESIDLSVYLSGGENEKKEETE